MNERDRVELDTANTEAKSRRKLTVGAAAGNHGEAKYQAVSKVRVWEG